MDTAGRGSSEFLQTEAPTSPSREHPPALSTLIGPPRPGGLQFPHPHIHDPEQTPSQSEASTSIRKKFKQVLLSQGAR
jgi:hypothetical protein